MPPLLRRIYRPRRGPAWMRIGPPVAQTRRHRISRATYQPGLRPSTTNRRIIHPTVTSAATKKSKKTISTSHGVREYVVASSAYPPIRVSRTHVRTSNIARIVSAISPPAAARTFPESGFTSIRASAQRARNAPPKRCAVQTNVRAEEGVTNDGRLAQEEPDADQGLGQGASTYWRPGAGPGRRLVPLEPAGQSVRNAFLGGNVVWTAHLFGGAFLALCALALMLAKPDSEKVLVAAGGLIALTILAMLLVRTWVRDTLIGGYRGTRDDVLPHPVGRADRLPALLRRRARHGRMDDPAVRGGGTETGLIGRAGDAGAAGLRYGRTDAHPGGSPARSANATEEGWRMPPLLRSVW